MSNIGNNINSFLTQLLGRDVKLDAIADTAWDSLTTLSGTTETEKAEDAASLSDTELYEIAETLLEQAATADADTAAEYEEIARQIFELITADGHIDIEEDEADTSDAKGLSDLVELDKVIEEEVSGDDDIDSDSSAAHILDSLEPEDLAEHVAALAPNEQAAILEYLNEDNSNSDKFNAVINALPQNSIDDVLEELYENSDEDVAEKVLAELKPIGENLVNILLAENGPLGTIEQSEDRANFLTHLLKNAESSTGNAIKTALKENHPQIVDEITVADDGKLDAFKTFLMDGNLSDLQGAISTNDNFERALDSAISNLDILSKGATAYNTAIQNIDRPENISNVDYTSNNNYIKTAINSALEGLDQAAFNDFVEELNTNNSHLTDEEYAAAKAAVTAFAATDENISLPEGEGERPVSFTNENLQAVVDAGHDVTTLQALDFDALLFALNAGEGDESAILEAITAKALESASNLKILHEALGNFPDIMDNLLEISENNPANPLLNFLTSDPTDYDDDEDYTALHTKFKNSSDQLEAILQDAIDDDLNTTYDTIYNLNEAENTLLTAIEAKKNAADAARDKAFDDYLNNGGSIADLANLDSDLYKAMDDKEDFFKDVLGYLKTKTASDQEEFFAAITPNSELHLALIQTADDALAEDQDDEFAIALKNITNNIANGNNVNNNDVKDVFKDDDLVNSAEDILDAFENLKEENILNIHVQEFLELANDSDGLTANEATTFITDLSPIAAKTFFDAILADDSALLQLGTDPKAIFSKLLTALEDADVETKKQFLKSIDKDSELFALLDNGNVNVKILNAIDNDDFSDIDDQAIKKFIIGDLTNTITQWIDDSKIDQYLDDITDLDVNDADTIDDVQDILDRAKANGDTQAVLAKLLHNPENDISDLLIIEIFDWLDDNNSEADAFLGNLPANSPFTKALTHLIDRVIDPFDDYSYTTNDNGTIKIDSKDINDIIDDLRKKDEEAVTLLANQITNEIENIAALEDAAGYDNDELRALTQQIQAGDTINFDDIFPYDTSAEEDKSENLIELFLKPDNYLFQTLNDAQLKEFMDDFFKHIELGDLNADLLEHFVEKFQNDDDSFFFNALVAAGVDPDDIKDADSDSDYKDLFDLTSNDVDNFVSYTRQGILNEQTNGAIGPFIANTLRGQSNNNDIEQAVDKTLDAAFYNVDTFDDFLDQVLNNDGVIMDLTPEQAEALLEGLFERLKNENGGAKNKFIKEFLDAYEHSDYRGDDDRFKDYYEDDSTRGLSRKLSNLFGDESRIKDFVKNNTSINEKGGPVQEVNDRYIGDEKNADVFTDQTILNGYSALIKLFGEGAIRSESGLLSDEFLNKNSARSIGRSAADQKLNMSEIVGLTAILPADEFADFIEAYLKNNGGNNIDEVGYLLGHLMTLQAQDVISDNEFNSIIDEIDLSNNDLIEGIGFDLATLKDDPQARAQVLDTWSYVAHFGDVKEASGFDIQNFANYVAHFGEKDKFFSNNSGYNLGNQYATQSQLKQVIRNTGV